MPSIAETFRRILEADSQLGSETMPLDLKLADMMAKFFPMPVLVLDSKKNRVAWANPGFWVFSNSSPKELLRLSNAQVLETFFSPAEPLLTLYQEKARQGRFSGQFRSPEGEKFVSGLWMGLPDDTGTCCQFILVFEDVTEVELMKQELLQYSEELQQQLSFAERLVAEKEKITQQLREQFEKIRLLATATAYSNMMKFILTPEGQIVWVNRTFEKALGWSSQELIGRHVHEIGETFAHLLPAPGAKPTEQTSILSHFRRAPFTEEIYAYDGEGRGHWMLLTVAPITNDFGEVTHYLGAMTNITRRKEREQELLRWKKELSDSLASAERIQRRFLPSGKESTPFSAFEVWYAPQMQVGGDFYTVQSVEGGIIVGMGDSTGHGVPASLLSIYAQTTLRQALSQYQADLEKVYTHLIEDVQEVFGGQSPLLDGFELALLWYDPQTKRAKYIGARRPLWVLRGGDIFIVSGDRRDISVTLSDRLSTALPSVQSLTLLPKDRLFLFSDGIVDQLNSEGKRFSTTHLRSFLQTNSYLSLNEQVELLKQAIRHWAGGMPQSDDILFLAMEV